MQYGNGSIGGGLALTGAGLGASGVLGLIVVGTTLITVGIALTFFVPRLRLRRR
jgi:hypothetical protein